MQNMYFICIEANGENILQLQGEWVIAHSAEIAREIKKADFARIAILDASQVGRMDLWGAMHLQTLAREIGADVRLNEDQKRTFDYLPMDPINVVTKPAQSPVTKTLEAMGHAATNAGNTVYGLMVFVGEISACFARAVINPRSFRFHSIVRHIEETGLRALPIVALLAVLISMVVAYQAATQLQKFGASIFTIDLTVISILREMGVLITAILVAGRSGSAFAAEIGVMKLREEIDALKTMGFNPIEILVLPRLIAMLITLPVLAFLADLMGLFGGGLVSIFLLNIPLDQYIDRVEMVAKPTMFFVGLIKAPVFAFVITLIGTYQGMNVSGSAESVGRLTTVAVVQSIFLVIMVDAMFSIVFSNMGL